MLRKHVCKFIDVILHPQTTPTLRRIDHACKFNDFITPHPHPNLCGKNMRFVSAVFSPQAKTCFSPQGWSIRSVHQHHCCTTMYLPYPMHMNLSAKSAMGNFGGPSCPRNYIQCKMPKDIRLGFWFVRDPAHGKIFCM